MIIISSILRIWADNDIHWKLFDLAFQPNWRPMNQNYVEKVIMKFMECAHKWIPHRWFYSENLSTQVWIAEDAQLIASFVGKHWKKKSNQHPNICFARWVNRFCMWFNPPPPPHTSRVRHCILLEVVKLTRSDGPPILPIFWARMG